MVEASFDTWTSIFLVAAFQGLFLALSLALGRQRSYADKFLAGLMLSFSLVLAYYVSFWTHYNRVYPFIEGYTYALPFLFGPFLYLYCKSFDVTRFKKTVLVHFIPFLIHFGYLLPFIILSGPEKVDILTNTQNIPIWRFWVARGIVVAQVLHILGYSILLFGLLRQQSNDRTLASKINRKIWFKRISLLFLVFGIIHASYYVMVFLGKYELQVDYLMSLGMSIIIYFVGYTGFRIPQFLGELPEVRKSQRPENFSPQMSNDLLIKLKKHMEDQKPFLDGDLKLGNLADQLGMKSHDLSQLLNDSLGQNFSEFINGFRIKEAERLLTSDNEDLKVIQVAYQCGFNTKTAFYNSFKRKNGVSPLLFRKTYLDSFRTGTLPQGILT